MENRTVRPHLSARLPGVSVLLSLCLVLALWQVPNAGGALARNWDSIRLLRTVAALSSPRAEELIGWQQRPKYELSAEAMDSLMQGDNHSVLTGAVLALLGQPAAAQRWLQSHATANTLDHYWLALALGQQDQRDASVQTLTGLNGIDQYFALAGFKAQEAGEFEQASRLLVAAAGLDIGQIGDRSLVYEYLAKNAYSQLHDWDQSFYWAERWIQAAPKNTYAYTWLAGLYLWRGQPEQASAALQRGQPYGIEHNPYYPGQIGQIYQSRGWWELAIENYRTSWNLHKDVTWMRPYVAWYLGFALFHQNQRDEARPYLQIAAQEGIQAAADILTQMDAGGSR
jgi:tetratricopeptide (TPR) repeat protein